MNVAVSLKKTLIPLFLSTVLVTSAGCSDTAQNTDANGQDAEKKMKIVATFYPMAEFSRQVAGDLATVEMLIPAGVEPHDWEPSAEHMKKIQSADLFVYNGIGMEGFVEQTLESLNTENLVVVETAKGLEKIAGDAHDHDHASHTEETHAEHANDPEHAGHDHAAHEEEAVHEDHSATDEHASHESGKADTATSGEVLDPHIWLDPVSAQGQVQAIADALAAKDAANAAAYQKNAGAYIEKLKVLDQTFKTAVTGAKHRAFITQHAAFGYMAKRYGLTQIPIAGLSPAQEPSAGQIADVAKKAKEQGIKVILFETLVSSKVAETLAKEIGAETAVLNPVEGLTDEEIKNGKTYINVMEQNAASLKHALSK